LDNRIIAGNGCKKLCFILMENTVKCQG